MAKCLNIGILRRLNFCGLEVETFLQSLRCKAGQQKLSSYGQLTYG